MLVGDLHLLLAAGEGLVLGDQRVLLATSEHRQQLIHHVRFLLGSLCDDGRSVDTA